MARIPPIFLVLCVVLAWNQPLGAQALRAPAWVKPGLRITYYTAVASIPGARTQLVPDPNGKDWWDPVTGQKFGERDIPGPSGHGLTELTVAYIDDRVAVLDIRLLGLNPTNNNSLSILTYSRVVGTPDNTEYWIHPTRLAAMRDAPGTGMRVYRMPYPMNGRTFNAVRINSASTSAVYDSESGILLFTAAAATGKPVITPDGDKARVAPGSTVLAQSRVLAARETTFPWNGTPLPQWFSRVQSIEIQGRVAADIDYAGTATLPLAGRIEFGGGGAHWREYSITTQTQGVGGPEVPSTVQRVSGNSSFGGLAVNPSALARLSPGQVLDQDQVTGMRTSVPHANTQYVVIAESGPGLTVQYYYDPRSGMLVRLTSVVAMPPARQTVDYALVNPH